MEDMQDLHSQEGKGRSLNELQQEPKYLYLRGTYNSQPTKHKHLNFLPYHQNTPKPPPFVSPYKDHRITASTVPSSSHPPWAVELGWGSQIRARAVLRIFVDALFHHLLGSCLTTHAGLRRLRISFRAQVQNPRTFTPRHFPRSLPRGF